MEKEERDMEKEERGMDKKEKGGNYDDDGDDNDDYKNDDQDDKLPDCKIMKITNKDSCQKYCDEQKSTTISTNGVVTAHAEMDEKKKTCGCVWSSPGIFVTSSICSFSVFYSSE